MAAERKRFRPRFASILEHKNSRPSATVTHSTHFNNFYVLLVSCLVFALNQEPSSYMNSINK